MSWFPIIGAGMVLLFSGCSQQPSTNAPNIHYQKLSFSELENQTFVSKEDLDKLFMQTKYVSYAEKNKLYITISRRLTLDAQYQLASMILDQVTPVTSEEFEEKHLLLAQQTLNMRHFDLAQRALKQLRHTPASATIRYQLLLSWYHYEQGSYSSYITALHEATHSARVQRPALEQPLIQTAWKSIQRAKPSQIEQLRAHTNEPIAGWLSLRELTDPMDNPNVVRAPESTLKQLRDWQIRYSDHSGNALFKTEIESYAQAMKPRKKIGLMLPLTGKHRQASQLIQKAFFTAYFDSRPLDQMISVYDTGQAHSYDQYQKATKQDGVESIIGPLTKFEIDDLLSGTQITTPTLVLNNTSSHPQLLSQYSLAPSEETGQLVSNMILSGYRHPLVLSDGSSASTTLANEFTEQFRSRGGVIADATSVDQNMNLAVSQVMGTDKSQSRHRFAQSLSASPIRVVAEKRRDADSIFIASGAVNTRQLIPMLKYHYSGNLPIFSTSLINKTSNPHKNQDLNSAIFFDTPLLPSLPQSPKRMDFPKKVMDKLRSSDPTGFFDAFRFYGLGFDAFVISQTGYLWDILDGYTIIGVNGALSRDINGRIQRELSRMVFKNGVATIDSRYDIVREQWRQLTHDVIA